MTREEIINGLKMSIDLMLFDPTTGEVKEPHQLNDMDRTSYEAFKGAMEILAQPKTKCIAKITLNKEQVQDAVEKAKREILVELLRWMNDNTISREAAIKALDNRFKQHLLKNRFESFEEADSETKWFCDGIAESIGAVMDLPSAQPEIIRCKDCKHNPKYEWLGCPMSHLSEAQRPETAWCWKAERRTDG